MPNLRPNPDAFFYRNELRPRGEPVLLGAHVSIAGGFHEAPKAGKWIGCDSIQIFSRSPRMLRRTKPITEEDVRRWRESLETNGIRVAVIHVNYLINLCSPQRRLLRVSRQGFVEEMERAQALGVRHLIFHPGAHMGKGEGKALKLIAQSLDACIDRADAPDVLVCLENTAGQGTTVGYKVEHLRKVVDLSKHPERLGVCLDTCHLFAAGYDIRTRRGYDNAMNHIDDVLGLDRVVAFHLNDSKGPVNCRLDRHDNIGKGKLKKATFRFLVNDRRFRDVPAVLEVPGGDPAFRRDLKVLRSLVAT